METENIEILLTNLETLKKVKLRIQDFQKACENIESISNSIFK